MTGCSSSDNNSSPSSQASSGTEFLCVFGGVFYTGRSGGRLLSALSRIRGVREKIRVAALKGPTAMGLVKLMDDNDHSEAPQCDFSIYASPD